jgi:hypothetical protein
MTGGARKTGTGGTYTGGGWTEDVGDPLDTASGTEVEVLAAPGPGRRCAYAC